MKITRDKMFFSKDLIHTLAYVGMFVAQLYRLERVSLVFGWLRY